MKDDLVYKTPAVDPAKNVRRVYVLPRDLVQRIHDYGYAHNHDSEVSAVRELLDRALLAREQSTCTRDETLAPPGVRSAAMAAREGR